MIDFTQLNNTFFYDTDKQYIVDVFNTACIVATSFLFSSIFISKYGINSEYDWYDDDDEPDIPYEDKYPIDSIDNNIDTEFIPNKSNFIAENTPNGTVFMRYDKDNEGFDYWCNDNQIEYKYLETVARKFIKIFNCKNSNLKRAEELFNKTNQYNFSLNRYKSNDIINIMSKKKFEIKLFSLKDKFGDHGIIGAYVIEKKKENVLISDFVLSCRVLYRYVEQFILGKIISQFPKKNIEIVYKKTNVNSNLIPKFLKKQNFDLSRKNKDCFFYNVKFNRESIDETKRIF